MINWIKIKKNHITYHINIRNISYVLYNESTKCIYIYMINDKTIEIVGCTESDLNVILKDLE